MVMYLQITTKCNMSCEHCCYSCNMRGKHMNWATVIDAIDFASGYTECISIGGGEPTLHPRFFDILKICLDSFDYVWFATNGSQTDMMYRISNIINGEDFPECTCEEDDPDEFEEYGCLCHEKMDNNTIWQDNRLGVALSLDPWHDAIDQRVIDLWRRNSFSYSSHKDHYEIRDVSKAWQGIAAQGRAKLTGAGWSEHCPCSTNLIRPNGKIKLCGCTRAPIIGDIWNGIEDKWIKRMETEEYQNTLCYRGK